MTKSLDVGWSLPNKTNDFRHPIFDLKKNKAILILYPQWKRPCDAHSILAVLLDQLRYCFVHACIIKTASDTLRTQKNWRKVNAKALLPLRKRIEQMQWAWEHSKVCDLQNYSRVFEKKSWTWILLSIKSSLKKGAWNCKAHTKHGIMQFESANKKSLGS